ncbi:DUF2339 domain-containing protein [Flammeovirga aprica]|uniref:DUF2339 domain-containing protein n=1 Tax=Flammeovirga aprica JL-4 TaxID=694437 RepID=A0A7X9XBI0_9BACT|nr:DUF2339 domain-containing protein [Flammeovirga aprica]NME70766.1 DUF2339 domain-containing protein [Flammeovirga aprica JL-4]
MTNDHKRINELEVKFQLLVDKQNSFAADINHLKYEINQLKISISKADTEIETKPLTDEPDKSIQKEKEIINQPMYSKVRAPNPLVIRHPQSKPKPVGKSNLEKFIGENLINKIGILILIIGIGIGGKYSIDNELISPVTRIILGYLASFSLLGFGIKLKEKYTNYSAVLVSGAIAIMYFMTFMAHSLYDLIPVSVTFVMMVIFTIFTAIASLHYNKQVLAIIGLVGAYAVPFLLSNGDGNTNIFFSYIAVINIGILFLAFKKYWTILQKLSFGITWVIYLLWISENSHDADVYTSSIFLFIYFATFYTAFLAYKLLHKEEFKLLDIFLILSNAFLFYGLGFSIIDDHGGENYLGLYTLLNACIHFGVSFLLYTKKEVDRNVFYLATALVLTFITIAIPVQFNGNGVTLLWVGEATILFWIGRTKKIYFYEKLSYPLMLLAFVSMFEDYHTAYGQYYGDNEELKINFLLNVQFLCSVLFIAGFSFINYIHLKTLPQKEISPKDTLTKLVSIGIPSILMIIAYLSLFYEIDNYWDQLYIDSIISTPEGSTIRNYDLNKFSELWLINYTIFFGAMLSILNYKKVRNKAFAKLNFIVVSFSIFLFLIVGTIKIGALRSHYISQYNAEYYNIGIMNIGIRYVSILLIALVLFVLHKNNTFFKGKVIFTKAYDFLLYFTVLCILSNELIHWMELSESTQSDKLGLSILWGIYALVMIGIGIWKKIKHVRMGAIALFGITLFKLFFYDIADLNTIAKTIVFVSLGVLLLIISFLYNKYKTVIFNEDNNE